MEREKNDFFYCLLSSFFDHNVLGPSYCIFTLENGKMSRIRYNVCFGIVAPVSSCKNIGRIFYALKWIHTCTKFLSHIHGHCVTVFEYHSLPFELGLC